MSDQIQEKYLNMLENYENIKLEDLEENNISVQSIPVDINNSKNNINYNNNKDILNLKEGPIKLIEFEKSNFKLNNIALEILRLIKEEIIVVSIVGKARTGKSYLMNLLLNINNNNYLNEGFQVASSINSCTRGIWLWNTPKQKPNSSAKIIFLDSEGTNSVDLSTKTYDSKIFALIILLSSLFIYNTNGNIDEQSISELALASYLSSTIAINSNTNINKDELISDLAPKFIWTLRDFSLDKIDPDTGEEISSDQYLELCLRNKSTGKNSENNLIRENIIKYFKERECVTLPRPIDKEENLQNLNNIPFSELKPNFRSEFLLLKRKVYESSKPKIFKGKRITGPILADLLIIFIDCINSGKVPNINSAWDNIILKDIEDAYEDCKIIWKQNIEKYINDINIQFLYDLKYFIISEFNSVIEKNGEIKYNKKYFKEYNNFKNKLDDEIQKEINKIISNLNKKNTSFINQIINKNKNILYSNISNSRKDEKFTENFSNSLLNYYNKILKDINRNSLLSNSDNFKLLYQTDINITKDMISYILNNSHKNMVKKKLEIEKEIKMNEINISPDLRFNNVNNDFDIKYNSLKKELDSKNKEIMHLIAKYTKLMEKRDELIGEKNKFNGNASLKSNSIYRNSLLKTSVNQFYCDLDTKVCGCEFKDDICYIY